MAPKAAIGLKGLRYLLTALFSEYNVYEEVSYIVCLAMV